MNKPSLNRSPAIPQGPTPRSGKVPGPPAPWFGPPALTDVPRAAHGSATSQIAGATVFKSTGELVPVPEASTLLGVLGRMAPLAWRERRHWVRCRAARA